MSSEVADTALPRAAHLLVFTPHQELVHFAKEILVQHGREAGGVAQGTGPVLMYYLLHARAAEMVATAACEHGLTVDVETDGAGKVVRWRLHKQQIHLFADANSTSFTDFPALHCAPGLTFSSLAFSTLLILPENLPWLRVWPRRHAQIWGRGALNINSWTERTGWKKLVSFLVRS